MNDIMKKIWENQNYILEGIKAINKTPVQENMLNKVIKEGIGQK
jgi:hypothetical protein